MFACQLVGGPVFFARFAIAANDSLLVKILDIRVGPMRCRDIGKRMLISRSGKYFFDILNIKASKGNSLKKLIKRLKISKEEVISFGDSQNDISLFKESGFSIAVKNSYPELIELADAITDENHKSGLGKAIYKYILHKTVSTEAEF